MRIFFFDAVLSDSGILSAMAIAIGDCGMQAPAIEAIAIGNRGPQKRAIAITINHDHNPIAIEFILQEGVKVCLPS
jgi:hypothetical protein